MKRSLSQINASNNQESLNTEESIEEVTDDNYYSVEASKSCYIIPPNHFFKIIWDIANSLNIVYQAIVMPYMLAFETEIEGALVVIDIFQDFFFMIDILITFNTGIVLEGLLILNRLEIAKSYLKGWFVIDFFSSVPYSMILENNYFDIKKGAPKGTKILSFVKMMKLSKVMRLVRLLKIAKLKIIVKYIEELYNSKMMSIIIEFMKIILLMTFLSHWMACIWYVIGNTSGYSWLDNFSIRDLMNFDKYIASIYFILISMITVGFGDILPINSNERMFVIALQILSGIFFSYIMGSMGALLQSINNNQEEESIKRISMKQYLIKKKINNKLLARINDHLEYSLKSSNNSSYDIDLFNMLSDKLQDEVTFSLNKRLLNTFKILSSKTYFVKYLIKEIKEESIFSKEIVYLEGEHSNKIFFLLSGTLVSFIEEIDVITKQIEISSVFGHIELLGGFDRLFSVESLDLSKVSVFDIDAFRKSVNLLMINEPDEYIEFKDYIFEIRSSIRVCNFINLNIYCDMCGANNHLADTCFILVDEEMTYKLKFRSKAFRTDTEIKERKSKIQEFYNRKTHHSNSLKGINDREYILFNE